MRLVGTMPTLQHGDHTMHCGSNISGTTFALLNLTLKTWLAPPQYSSKCHNLLMSTCQQHAKKFWRAAAQTTASHTTCATCSLGDGAAGYQVPPCATRLQKKENLQLSTIWNPPIKGWCHFGKREAEPLKQPTALETTPNEEQWQLQLSAWQYHLMCHC